MAGMNELKPMQSSGTIYTNRHGGDLVVVDSLVIIFDTTVRFHSRAWEQQKLKVAY